MLQNNLSALKRNYLELYLILEKYRESIPFKYKPVLSKNQMNNLIVDGNIFLHSQYDPKKEANSWVKSVNLQNNEDTIIIIGFGLGYYLEILVEKFSDKKIIIIEPDIEIFIHSISYTDISHYINNDNIAFIVGKEPMLVGNLIQYYLQNNKIKKFYITELPIYNRLFKDYIVNTYLYVKKMAKDITCNIYTELYSSRRWLYNVIRNIKYVKEHHNIIILQKKLKKLPVIIVSAGPSLEKQLPRLKQIGNNALIIAVGSAAIILDKHDIIPHIIMAVDGNPSEAEIFRYLNNHKPLLLYNHILHYEILNLYKGEKIWFSLKGYNYLEELFKELNIEVPWLLSGPSIANIALGFADWLESPNIIFIGQDLAFTNMHLYAKGCVNQQIILEEQIKQKGYILKKDVYGNDIYTKSTFLSFKSWFEDYIKLRERKNGIYNCTEGGIPIEGIPNVLFEEVLNKYCVNNYNIDYLIEKCLNQKLNISEEKIDKYLFELKEKAENIYKLSLERLKIMEELLNEESINDYNPKFDKVTSIGEEIEQYDIYHNYIYFTGKSYLNAITSEIQKIAEKEETKHNKRLILLQGLMKQYKFIHENIEIMLKALRGEEVQGLFE